MAHYHSSAALKKFAHAARLSPAEVTEVLIRRYLPVLMEEMAKELDGDTRAIRMAEWAAQNCQDHPRRRVGLAIRKARLDKGWGRYRASKVWGSLWLWDGMECGRPNWCKPATATKAAITLESPELTEMLKSIGWWKGS